MPRFAHSAALAACLLFGGLLLQLGLPAAEPSPPTPAKPSASSPPGEYQPGDYGDRKEYRGPYGTSEPAPPIPPPVAPAVELPSLLRRPVGLAFAADERWLYAACTSGTISIVDLQRGAVVGETRVGRRLASLAPLPNSTRLLATDTESHELLLLDAQGTDLKVLHRLAVAPFPVSTAIARDGRGCVVASLWSRRLTWVELPADASAAPRVAEVTDLDFPPREQIFVRNDSRLLVADAFTGRLAIFDAAVRRPLAMRAFPAHNIRGLGLSPDGKMLIVAQQMLNDLAQTLTNDIHWGLVISNDLRWLKLDAALDSGENFFAAGHMHPLGQAGSATGDPAGLAVTSKGLVIATLGGVGEIALGEEQDYNLQRLKVGRRPEAVVADRAGRRAYVANRLDDTLSIIDLEQRRTLGALSLGPQPKLGPIDRGELLFYDATLSHDGWMSCHSCHTDGHANGQLNDNFSDGSFGAAKRVLSLLGTKGTAPFAWNGSRDTLEDQVRASVTATMQGKRALTDGEAADLTAFLEALPAPPSVAALRGTADAASIARGEKLFRAQECIRCHAPPLYTTPGKYDVGLRDKLGTKEFNPPSLRGLSQRGPFFHDHRAATLPDVFLEHGHQLKRPLSLRELNDLLAFLRSL